MTELEWARRHLQKCQGRLAEMRALHVRLQDSCKEWTDVALAKLAKIDAETELRAALSWAWDAQQRSTHDDFRDVGVSRVRHLKRGTEYEVIGTARLQSAKPVRDMDPVVVYRADKDGTLWARAEGEFCDGRFAPVF